MKSRSARVDRRTTETDIRARLSLDGRGRYTVSTGIRFLDHMLELFTRHGGFDLDLRVKGDLDVDRQALGDKRGINRAGYFVMPMDETLAVAAIDLSGRPYLVLRARIRPERVGDLQTELLEDFFQGFASGARANVHLRVLYGRSSHHAVEAIFKAFGRALRYACSRDACLKRQLPSTKGLL